MSINDLLAGCSADPTEYQFTTVISKKGRKVEKASEPLAELQKRLLRRLEQMRIPMPSAVGGVPGWSPVKNALHHKRGRYFYILDFKGAFPSVAAPALAKVLCEYDPTLGSLEGVTRFLERYCVLPEKGLVQGGSASMYLFNLYCEKHIDGPIRRYLAERQDAQGKPLVRYTRFVDDLVFSSVRVSFGRSFRRRLRSFITAAGFVLHPQKTRVLEKGVDAIVINSIQLLPDGHVGISRKTEERIAPQLDLWLDGGEREMSQQLQGLIGQYKELVPYLANNRTSRRFADKTTEMARRLAFSKPEPDTVRLFPHSWLDELRSLATYEEFVGKAVKLKWNRRHTEAVGLCPFHNERTPSFTINPEKNFFHCFGCGAHGDVIGFVMRIENRSFVSAVKHIAGRVGLSLPEAPAGTRRVQNVEDDDIPF